MAISNSNGGNSNNVNGNSNNVNTNGNTYIHIKSISDI